MTPSSARHSEIMLADTSSVELVKPAPVELENGPA